MYSLIKKIFRPKNRLKVIILNDRIYIFCEKIREKPWQFSYFFIGSYGNYLFGIPQNIRDFYDIIQAKGGIKYHIPWSKDDLKNKDNKYIFIKYGSIMLLEKSFTKDYPIRPLNDVVHADIKIDSQDLAGELVYKVHYFSEKYLLGKSIKFKNKKVCIPDDLKFESSEEYKLGKYGEGKINDIIDLIKNSKNLDSSEYLIESSESKTEKVSSQVKELTDSQIHLFIKKLEEEKLIFYFDRSSMSLSFFDDIEFERNDLEIVDTQVRNQLQNIFEKNGYIRNRGDTYIKKNSGNKVSFSYIPTPHTRMMSLTYFKDLVSPDTIKIITPTQQAALILESEIDVESRFLDLCRLLPINIKKIKPLVDTKFSDKNREKIKSKLYKLQKECCEFYRTSKPKGAKGKSLK
ncbi:MAG: hypothetical protein CMP11_08815 [Zetaproteobacteria bacterium]|nr:hypothetical protein [Pseudobdellovibrionaceae bacterium]